MHGGAAFPEVRTIAFGTLLTWLRWGAEDFARAVSAERVLRHLLAPMGWLIALTFRHAYPVRLGAGHRFFLVGPFFAIGLYDLSRRRQRGELPYSPRRLMPAPERRCDRHVRTGCLHVRCVWRACRWWCLRSLHAREMPSLEGFGASVLSGRQPRIPGRLFPVGGFFLRCWCSRSAWCRCR
ncbi:MAG: DUF2189 domain-containing protein [Betaproteobacteria bacterium]|nr:DUF2189 domain-containing protein [Betaproteobacteria bacterium]